MNNNPTYLKSPAECQFILAVETTGPIASIALAIREQDRMNITEQNAEAERTHLTELMPRIQNILSASGAAPQDLDAIAVSAGPGSFTGIRIGVSAVRAMAQALNIGIIKVPTLETFVYHDEGEYIACPIFDARRSQMYAGAFLQTKTGPIRALTPGGAWDPEDFLNNLAAALRSDPSIVPDMPAAFSPRQDHPAGQSQQPDASPPRQDHPPLIRFYGDGVPVFRTYIEAWLETTTTQALFADSGRDVQRAKSVLQWALSSGETVPYWDVEPIYMRKAEAQRKLDESRACGAGVQHGLR